MTRQKPSKKSRSKIWKSLSLLLLIGVSVLGMLAVLYVLRLDARVTSQFEGRRWELPARVYARPKDLYTGLEMQAKQLSFELGQLHYARVPKVQKPGEYSDRLGRFEIYTRGFHFPDEYQDAARIALTIDNGAITRLEDAAERQPLGLFRLEPVRIANIYPKQNEDRLLVKLDQVPIPLLTALLTIEDQSFYQHHGVQPKAIFRAMWANLRAGHTVQGGSTLTQQLVKNFYLSNERTLTRKLNEAIMALLLEWHYDKNEILEAYLNEIYLGQDGARAIHGFGLAAQFYFQRDLSELPPEQLFLLVGMAKGASYYDPRRFPERALERRNLVIKTLVKEGLLDADAAAILEQRPIGVTPKIPSGITAYPAFLDLVRRQLRRDYRDEDLRSEGLSIFTTFDPLIQHQSEQALLKQLAKIEKDRGLEPNVLQGALVVATVDQGEVLAIVGGRDPRYAGFNRALDMQRPVGSMIKPAVYLTALSHPDHYHLLTQLDDSELVMQEPDGTEWRPKNYDEEFHAHVALIQGLVYSYNIATIRLALEVGLENVVKMVHQLGIQVPVEPFPSLALGAAEVPPIEALQMYQTISAGGYKTPLRAILAVVDQQGQTLQRYPLTVEQAARADAVFLLTTALHHVTISGTARALQYLLPKHLSVAGKTGTTNDLRDSWFGGFSGEHVAIAWVGRDDNESTGLTGSSGALRVWAEVMAHIPTQPLQPLQPDNIDWAKADVSTGLLVEPTCNQGVWLPFIRGSQLPQMVSCDVAETLRSLQTEVADDSAASNSESAKPASGPRGGSGLRGLFH